MMSRPWVRFLAGLELKGITFEDVALASDRIAVIRGVGIDDPLMIAILETEWANRVPSSPSTGVGGGGGSYFAPGSGTTDPPVSSAGVSASSSGSLFSSSMEHSYQMGRVPVTYPGPFGLTSGIGGSGGGSLVSYPTTSVASTPSRNGGMGNSSSGGTASPGGGRTPTVPRQTNLAPTTNTTTTPPSSLLSSPVSGGGRLAGKIPFSSTPSGIMEPRWTPGAGSTGAAHSLPPSPLRGMMVLPSVPGNLALMNPQNNNNNSTTPYAAGIALPSPQALGSLPEELQDVVMTREVLQAAVGIGGMFLQLHHRSSRGMGISSSTTRVDPLSGISTSGGGGGAQGCSMPTSESGPSSLPSTTTAVEGGGAPQFMVSSLVPVSLRSICEMMLPIADAFVALYRVRAAEFLGRSLVGMAIGEVVSEICTAYALEVAKLEQWSRVDPAGRRMPLMRVVSELQRLGYPIVRLRQVLPIELLEFSDNRSTPSSSSTTTTTGTSVTHRLDPSMTSMSLGASPLPAATPSPAGGAGTTGSTYLCGPRLLNHLGDQLQRCGGSKEDSDVLQLLLHRAMVPYLRMLQRWMHEGIVEDPFGEFFIVDNAAAMMPGGGLPSGSSATTSSSTATSSFSSSYPFYSYLTYAPSSYYPSAASTGGGGGSSGTPGSSAPSPSAMMTLQMQRTPFNKYISEVFPDVSGGSGMGIGIEGLEGMGVGAGVGYTSYYGGKSGAVPRTSTLLRGSSYRYDKGAGMLSFTTHEAEAFERRFHMNTLLMPSFLETPNRRRRIAKMIFFTGKYCCILRECQAALPDFSHFLQPEDGGRPTRSGVGEKERTTEEGPRSRAGMMAWPSSVSSSSSSSAGTSIQKWERFKEEEEERRGRLVTHTRGKPPGHEWVSSFVMWENMEDLHRMIQRSFEIASQTVIRLLFSPRVDLLGHLENIKVFYLHSRGDWITDFLDSAEEMLSQSRDQVKAHSLRVLLQASIARSCHTSHYPYHDRVGCRISAYTLAQQVMRSRGEGTNLPSPTGKPTTKSGGGGGMEEEHERVGGGRSTSACSGSSTNSMPSSGGGLGEGSLFTASTGGGGDRHRAGSKTGSSSPHRHLRCLEFFELDVDHKWPLTLVLDAKVMQRFNTIFRLLTWVKVCERTLCTLWSHNEVLATFPAAYGIKHQLIQFLRQYQFFAAHFVLEPLWSRLMNHLAGGSAESLFSISQALHTFFTDAERRLTLSSPTRFKSLRGLLELVSRFVEVGKHSSAATMPLIEGTLLTIQDQFLSGLSELAAAVGPDYPQLVPLLTFIDFNGFYDQHNVYHVQNAV